MKAHELKARKRELEARVAGVLSGMFAQFEAETGVPVCDISVLMVDVSTVGEPDQHTIARVSISLDL